VRTVVLLGNLQIQRYLCILVVAVLFLPMLVRPALAQSAQVTIPVLTKPLTLDGKWTSSDEWSDAVEITTPGGFFRLKQNQTYLYVLFDYVNCKTLVNYDVAWVYVDTRLNGGASPQPDDYAFSFQWSSPTQSTLVTQAGTGSGWASASVPKFAAASSTDSTNDPYSSSPHVIYEFQIPLSIIPQGRTYVAIRLAMQDGSRGTWMVYPKNSFRSSPSQWGTMQLGSLPIPEFPAILPALALGLILPLYLLRKEKRNKDA